MGDLRRWGAADSLSPFTSRGGRRGALKPAPSRLSLGSMTDATRRRVIIGGAGLAVSAGTWLWLRDRGLTEEALPSERERGPPEANPVSWTLKMRG